MPRAEYARDLAFAALRPPASGADFCVSITGTLARYWLSLLYPLTTHDRRVAVIGALPKADYYDPHRLGRLPLALPRVTFARRTPRNTSATILLTDATPPANREWAKVLRVSTATETSLSDAGVHYRMPFPMFPGYVAKGWERRFADQRSTRRTTRILFAGNTDRALYDELTPAAVRRQHGLQLSRCEAVDALHKSLGPDDAVIVRQGVDDPNGLFDGRHSTRLVLVEWPAFQDAAWLRALGSSAFFLALPGVFMPMSHNVVEAMAAGCVPILPYAGWFAPALTDGVDCLTFTDGPSLVATVRHALTMAPADVERMRAAAMAYYDAHLAPDVVPARVAELPDGAMVFVQTEESDQTAKIERGSVAFPG